MPDETVARHTERTMLGLLARRHAAVNQFGIPDSSRTARVVEAASYVALAAWASWPLWLPLITERITA